MSNQLPEIAAPEHPQTLLAPPPGTPAAEPPKPAPAAKPQNRRRIWLYCAVLLVLALVAFWWYRSHEAATAAPKAGTAAKGGRGGAPAATPVVAVKATKGNIGVYVTGLGAITPIYTVTVKSRVDGQLMTVHFKEGDLVQKGDPLI